MLLAVVLLAVVVVLTLLLAGSSAHGTPNDGHHSWHQSRQQRSTFTCNFAVISCKGQDSHIIKEFPRKSAALESPLGLGDGLMGLGLSLGVGLDPGSDYPGFRYGCKKVTKEAKASLRAALPGSWFRPRQRRRRE